MKKSLVILAAIVFLAACPKKEAAADMPAEGAPAATEAAPCGSVSYTFNKGLDFTGLSAFIGVQSGFFLLTGSVTVSFSLILHIGAGLSLRAAPRPSSLK